MPKFGTFVRRAVFLQSGLAALMLSFLTPSCSLGVAMTGLNDTECIGTPLTANTALYLDSANLVNVD